MKILIAEDNAFSRTLLRKTISKAGFDAIVAENGEAAWEVFQQDDTPKLALIDWMMPGMSGLELCRKIREIDGASPVYIILLTAKTGKEDVLEGFAAGADDFIKKPFDSGELLARIQVGRRLVEQHALLHCLIDSIPDPIYFKDNSGLYLGCNTAYAQFVGKEEADLINPKKAEGEPSDTARDSHMEDLRVLAKGESTESEGWVTGARGEEVYHSTLKIPYLESAAGSSGMIAVSRDLTKRIQMEQEMQQLAVAVEQSTESIRSFMSTRRLSRSQGIRQMRCLERRPVYFEVISMMMSFMTSCIPRSLPEASGRGILPALEKTVNFSMWRRSSIPFVMIRERY